MAEGDQSWLAKIVELLPPWLWKALAAIAVLLVCVFVIRPFSKSADPTADDVVIGAANLNVTTTGINGTAVGATTPSTGSFTNITASGNVTITPFITAGVVINNAFIVVPAFKKSKHTAH